MKKAVLVVAVAAVLAMVGGGAYALTRDDDTTTRGTCEPASYELGVENDDEGLELTFELQSTAPGETWQVLVEQGTTTLLEGARLTDEDAEIDVDVLTRSGAGDAFTVTATPPAGEACVATLTR